MVNLLGLCFGRDDDGNKRKARKKKKKVPKDSKCIRLRVGWNAKGMRGEKEREKGGRKGYRERDERR